MGKRRTMSNLELISPYKLLHEILWARNLAKYFNFFFFNFLQTARLVAARTCKCARCKEQVTVWRRSSGRFFGNFGVAKKMRHFACGNVCEYRRDMTKFCNDEIFLKHVYILHSPTSSLLRFTRHSNYDVNRCFFWKRGHEMPREHNVRKKEAWRIKDLGVLFLFKRSFQSQIAPSSIHSTYLVG